MSKGKLFILSGPSGSGKTTLYNKLLKSKKLKGKLVRSISVTTRLSRKGERNKVDYFFISKKMFQYKKREGHFLESMKVFDNHYGTPKKYVNDQLSKGKSVLLGIDVKGAKEVYRKRPATIRLFVTTKNFKQLKARLTGRGSENKDILKMRLGIAKEELKESKNFDYILINDNFASCYARLEKIVIEEIAKP